MTALVRSLPPSLIATMRHLAPWVERTLCCVAEIPLAVKEVSDALAAHAYSARDVFAVELSLREALINAIRHGNKSDPEKSVRFRHLVLGDQVWIEIEDEGAGFRLADVPDPRDPEFLERPSGRGVLLMRTYMTLVEYDQRGNRVLMHKRRGASQRPAVESVSKEVSWEGA
jgi:serine/threonine-protein kinase RsbW